MDEVADHEKHPGSVRRRTLAWGTVVLSPLIFVGTLFLAVGLLDHSAADLLPVTALALAAIVALLAAWAWLVRHPRRFRSPAGELDAMLTEVRSGRLPIEELGRVDGPLRPLARQAMEMARELKQQRIELQRMQAEVRQLVAQRTDALEQKLGTLRLQASRDPLTGLYNRRAFDEHVQAVINQALDSGGDVCLLVLDLDNFKVLNDTLGHAAGDEFLRDVGQVIRSGIRQNDLGFRYGGDEFVVLMPDVTRDEADAAAQRLVGLIDSLGRTLRLARPVGVSAGLATLRELAERTAARLLMEADRRQYEVKEARRAMGLSAPRA